MAEKKYRSKSQVLIRSTITIIPLLAAVVLGITKPISVNTKISEVTIYSDRAIVTRAAAVTLGSGDHLLVFENLPDRIDQNSVQVGGKGGAVLKDIKFKRKHFTDEPDARIQKIAVKIEALNDSIKKLDNSVKHSNAEKSFLEKIIAKQTSFSEKSQSSEIDPEKWIKMVTFYRSKLEAFDREIYQVTIKKRAVVKVVEKLNRELSERNAERSKVRSVVEVIVHKRSKGSVNLFLSYLVFGPSWSSVYDLRVSSAKKMMEIGYNAIIRQSTGEDWRKCVVRLSTATPSVSGVEPQLNPWYLSYNRGYGYGRKRSLRKEEKPVKYKKSAPPSMPFAESAAEFDDGSDVVYNNASVQSNATTVLYVIPGKNTVLSDNQEHKLQITRVDFPAEFNYSATPKLSSYAYLKAKIKNSSEIMFLYGKANVFLDNNFVATSQLQSTAPNEEFWTYLGVDNSIKVEHKLIKKFESKDGVFKQKSRFVYEYLLTVTNNKKTDEEITIYDQLPISNNAEIATGLIKPSNISKNKNIKIDKQNIVQWNLKLKPSEKKELPLSFYVEYPQGKMVSGL